MRIGIVGGGGAGLTTAWLLEEHHEVTLFERDDRLGGHAHTIEVEAHGERLAIDAGFQFFGAGWPYVTFTRLLDALDVPRRPFHATMTLFRGSRSIVMPPLRRGLPHGGSLRAVPLGHLLLLRRFAAGIPSFLQQHDTSITIGEYLERRRLPASFVEGFLIPFLLSFWCIDRVAFLNTAAYNTLFYLASLTGGLRSPRQQEIEGGMKTYIDALVRDLTRTRLCAGTGIVRIAKARGGYTLHDTRGGRVEVDEVVLATNARDALRLVEPIREWDHVAQELRRFEFFDAVIAIHGDRRLMPHRESEWSVVNARWDGAHSQLSIWNPTRGVPVFRSWVTYEQRMPEPLYALVTYEHGMGTVEHFRAQRRLKDLQGGAGLWLAGMYTDDADSHESAVHSAVTVADRLDPGSRRRALLRA